MKYLPFLPKFICTGRKFILPSRWFSRRTLSFFIDRVLSFVVRWMIYMALAVLLAAAFLNIQYGIDHISMIAVFSVDEAFAIQLVSQNLQQNRLDPQGFYNYGYFYHSLVFYTAAFLGNLGYKIDGRLLAYLFRWISLASYGLLLFLGYKLTKLLTRDRLFSLCTTLFLASVPGVYSWAQQTHPDMLQAVLVTAAAYVACRRHNLIHVIGATLIAGLAFSTKYTGIFIFPFVVLPYLFSEIEREHQKNGTFQLKDWGKMLYIAIGMSVVFVSVWLITNPTVLQNSSEVLKDILFEKRHVSWGDGRAEPKNPLLWLSLLFHQFGVAGSMLLLLGIAVLIGVLIKKTFRRRSLFCDPVERNLLMLLLYSSTGLAYLMFQVNLRQDRYILHLIPILVVLGFVGLYRCIHDSAILKKRKNLFSVALLVIILPLCPATIQTQQDASHKYEHQYLKATTWIEEHYPPDTHILADNYSYRSPRLSQFMYVWGVEPEALEYAQPKLIIINKTLSGRWSWKKTGTKFADLNFEYGPYEGKREAIQAFHTKLFAEESPYAIVYEDTEIVILEDPRKDEASQQSQPTP